MRAPAEQRGARSSALNGRRSRDGYGGLRRFRCGRSAASPTRHPSVGVGFTQAQSEEVLAAANRRSASAQTELAVNTERRVRALRANGNVSQQAFDEAHLQYRVSRAQLEVAQASLGRAQAAVEAMEVALSEAEIRAPFGGIIQARHVDEGSQIGPGSPALSLVETSKREAHIGIPESAVTSLTVGDAHTINWQNVSASAQLRSLLPEVNPNTRTVTAVFTVADQRIPLGAVVELSLRQRVPGNGFWVPIEALTAMDRGLWGVFIIDAENVVQQRLVEIVHNEGDRAFVRGLLSTNDRVVATGTQRIVAGQRVIPIAAQMNISAREPFLYQPRVSALLVLFIVVLGGAAFAGLPRQEDPKMAERYGMVVTFLPGATAQRMETLISEPIEQPYEKFQTSRS